MVWLVGPVAGAWAFVSSGQRKNSNAAIHRTDAKFRAWTPFNLVAVVTAFGTVSLGRFMAQLA
jgi:hypothetical protein